MGCYPSLKTFFALSNQTLSKADNETEEDEEVII